MSAAVSGGVYPDKRPDPTPVGPQDIIEGLKTFGVEVLLVDGRALGRNLREAPLTLIEAFARERQGVADYLTETVDDGGDDVAVGESDGSTASTTEFVSNSTGALAPAIARIADADRPARELADGWARRIDEIQLPQHVGEHMATLIDRARRVVEARWHLQAARMGWSVLEVFGLSPAKPWERLDRQGIAFASHNLIALDREVAVYEHGLRRQRSLINNDGGAVPIWEISG